MKAYAIGLALLGAALFGSCGTEVKAAFADCREPCSITNPVPPSPPPGFRGDLNLPPLPPPPSNEGPGRGGRA